MIDIEYKAISYPQIDHIRDAIGRTVVFVYSGTGRYATLTELKYVNYKDSNPDTLRVNYLYNATGQLSGVAYPQQDTIYYGYTDSVLRADNNSWLHITDSTQY